MRRISYSHVVCLAVPYYFTLSYKTARFSGRGKGGNLLTLCVLIFSTTLVPNICHSKKRNEQEMIINVHMSSCKSHAILVGFPYKLNFLAIFTNNNTRNFMEIRPVEAELFHSDGQT